MVVYVLKSILAHNSALIYQKNFRTVLLKTGTSIKNELIGEPLTCTLDEELRLGPLPTFFESPGWIVKKNFWEVLSPLIGSDAEIFPTVIVDEIDAREINDYILVNLLKSVPCADMDASKYHTFGTDTFMINSLVLTESKVPSLDIFLLREDPSIILVSEKTRKVIESTNVKDVDFHEVQQRAT